METFKYRHINNPQSTDAFNVTTVRFGDGYEQSVSNGLNIHRQLWPLEFGPEEAVEVRAFLIRHQGHLPFKWTNPYGEEGIYKQSGDISSVQHGNGVVSLAVSFRQTFKP